MWVTPQPSHLLTSPDSVSKVCTRLVLRLMMIPMTCMQTVQLVCAMLTWSLHSLRESSVQDAGFLYSHLSLLISKGDQRCCYVSVA